jgi:hypothetical protein
MDQELKQYLDSNFARIDERFAEVDRRAEALEERLLARIEKTETNLLGAFYGWARPMEIRVDSVTKTVMGFDERLALAERRISELERRRAS